MSSVVSNPDLLNDAAHQRGLVTLLQQICGQFVSRRLLAVTPDEDRQPLLRHLFCPLALVVAVDVLPDRAGDDLVVDAGADQLAADAQPSHALPSSRADKGPGKARVIEPFLGGEA